MKKNSNTQSKNHYSGIMKDFQQLGSSFKNEKYSVKEKSTYTEAQNRMYKRACYGLKIYTQEELSNMHWSKKNRIKKVNARAQKEINLLKQERCISISNDIFLSLFKDSTITHELINSFSEPSPKVFNKMSLKDLSIGKEDIIDRLCRKGILPNNFSTL